MVFVTAAAVAPDGSALLTVRSDVSGIALALLVEESRQSCPSLTITPACAI